MDRFMNWLYARMRPLLEARWFDPVVSAIIFVNPIALFPQVFVALTAPNIEGISVPMWYMVAAIQGALVMNGIKKKDAIVSIAMGVSLIESIVILVAVHVRG